MAISILQQDVTNRPTSVWEHVVYGPSLRPTSFVHFLHEFVCASR